MCVFSQTRLEYLGQIGNKDGVNKNPAKVKAIVDMPQPKEVSDLRRCLGMVNQLIIWSEITQPLQDQIKKGTACSGVTPRRSQASLQYGTGII